MVVFQVIPMGWQVQGNYNLQYFHIPGGLEEREKEEEVVGELEYWHKQVLLLWRHRQVWQLWKDNLVGMRVDRKVDRYWMGMQVGRELLRVNKV